MERLTERTTDGSGGYKIQAKNLDSHCVAKDKRGYVTYYGQHIDKLAEYEDLEGRLNGISIEQVVNGFIKTVENQTNEDYEHGRILTNAEADKWNEYKQLEEQGLLLRLPCKVGDTVYALRYGEENDFIIVETKIIEIRQNMNGIFFEPLISRKAYKTEDFGKTVFLTKAEAEQKLKKMERD